MPIFSPIPPITILYKEFPIQPLINTADHDDRVVPIHSYKFAAALQEAQGSDRPILLRIEGQSGHGHATSRSMALDTACDLIYFLQKELH